MKLATLIAAAAVGLVQTVSAVRHNQLASFRNANFRVAPAGQPPVNLTNAKHAYFQQWIDHDNHALGKFSQFYYWDDYYYKGAGYPVVLFTPGEINVTNYYTYLTTNRTSGVIAKEIGAAVIVLERTADRYWGVSTPYADLSTENMQYLTLHNSIEDLNNFAQNAVLPFDKTGASNAPDAPWVLIGGSYSGALTAWTEALTKPSVMWAYYASSAVVEAIGNYWQYFYPETIYMPQNCSNDLSRVVEYLDDVYENGSLQKQRLMKKKFGLQNLPHYDDFMAAIVNGPYQWQGNQFYFNTGFFEFCDYVEDSVNKTKGLPGASGVGTEKALEGYAKWVKEILVPGYCESYGYPEFQGTHNVQCFNTYDKQSPLFTDRTVSNQIDRQWNWMLCNEPFGYWQNGSPEKQKTIVSRLISNKYWVRQCSYFFPTENGYTFGLNKGVSYEDVNDYTGGWSNRSSTRLLYVNGQYDPWRQSTVSSSIRPGGASGSSPQQPVLVVPGGYHTSDLITQNGVVNKDVAAVQSQAVGIISDWVSEFYA